MDYTIDYIGAPNLGEPMTTNFKDCDSQSRKRDNPINHKAIKKLLTEKTRDISRTCIDGGLS